MAEARLLRRPAAALLRRLVRRIRSVDSAVAAASGKRLGQSAGVVPGWLDISDVAVTTPVSRWERSWVRRATIASSSSAQASPD